MRPPRSAGEILKLLFCNGVGVMLLLGSTLLRETPVFWRNYGGYPIWLRYLVLCLHYPLLVAVIAGSLAATRRALRFYRTNQEVGLGVLLVCAVQWLIILTALVIMLWNNVDNFLNGQPLHFHSPE